MQYPRRLGHAGRVDQDKLCCVTRAVGHVGKEQASGQTSLLIQGPCRGDEVFQTFVEQNPNSYTSLVLRSQLSTVEVMLELRRTLAQIDPTLPFVFHTWPDALALVLFPARVATATLGVMGLLAAMLAVTGVFGMAMYSVSKRMREFGIRVAVGAQPVQLMRSALSRPLILLLSGSAAGLLLGAMASQLLAQIVYQATPRDPVVFAGVMTTMALLGFVATWIPAQRALRVHPTELLRQE